MKKEFTIYSMVLLIVFVMVGAAELFHQHEIIFPEITAIAVGALMAPKMTWQTSRIRILIFVMICALAGVAIVLFLPGPVWFKVTFAYGVAEIICSGTSFAPMISAIALPVLLGTESAVYPIAAFFLTSLILGCHVLLVKKGIKEEQNFLPVKAGKTDWIDAVKRLILVGFTAFFALKLNFRFSIAPPLLVAFTEFSKKESGARKIPVKVVLAIALCGLIGAVCRLIIHLSLHLPLTLAALTAAILMILLLRKLKVYVPPAGALCILPMLIPAEAVLLYPMQIFAGALLFMALSLKAFPTEK